MLCNVSNVLTSGTFSPPLRGSLALQANGNLCGGQRGSQLVPLSSRKFSIHLLDLQLFCLFVSQFLAVKIIASLGSPQGMTRPGRALRPSPFLPSLCPEAPCEVGQDLVSFLSP